MNLGPDDDRNVADLLVHARQVLRTLDDGLTHDGAAQTINWLVEMLEETRRALETIAYIGGDDLAPDECVLTLALARGFALRMLGGKVRGGRLADEIEALARKVSRA